MTDDLQASFGELPDSELPADLVRHEAVKQGVDPDFAHRIMQQESGGNARARSSRGAIGAMQLMPATARRLRVNPHDPYQNIQGGVRELKRLNDKYGGDQTLTAVGYNAGEGAADRYKRGGRIPRETQGYIKAVKPGTVAKFDDLPDSEPNVVKFNDLPDSAAVGPNVADKTAENPTASPSIFNHPSPEIGALPASRQGAQRPQAAKPLPKLGEMNISAGPITQMTVPPTVSRKIGGSTRIDVSDLLSDFDKKTLTPDQFKSQVMERYATQGLGFEPHQVPAARQWAQSQDPTYDPFELLESSDDLIKRARSSNGQLGVKISGRNVQILESLRNAPLLNPERAQAEAASRRAPRQISTLEKAARVAPGIGEAMAATEALGIDKDIQSAATSTGAGLVQTAKNVWDLTGGKAPTESALARTLYEQADAEAQLAPGTTHQIIRGLAKGGFELPKVIGATMFGLPAPVVFAGLGALENAHRGLAESGKGAVEGALFGAAPELAAGMPGAIRVPLMAGIGGVPTVLESAAQGASPKEALTAAIPGAVQMGAFGMLGGEGKAEPRARLIPHGEPVKVPEGQTTTRVRGVGTFVHDPTDLTHAEVRAAVREGRTDELLQPQQPAPTQGQYRLADAEPVRTVEPTPTLPAEKAIEERDAARQRLRGGTWLNEQTQGQEAQPQISATAPTEAHGEVIAPETETELARLQRRYDSAQADVKKLRREAKGEEGNVGPLHQQLEMAGKKARGLGMQLSAAKKTVAQGEPVAHSEAPKVEAGGKEPLATTPQEAAQRYKPLAYDSVVDGRKIINAGSIPNLSSIDSSVDNPKVLPGIHEVPMSEFELTGKHYSVEGQKRIDSLAEQIKHSKEITPLIVVMDREGAYILEGATRVDALHNLGAKSFPAKVVLDMDSFGKVKPTEPMPEAKLATEAQPAEVHHSEFQARDEGKFDGPPDGYTPKAERELPTTAGIARRVEESRRGPVPDTGGGIGARESVEHGRELLSAGHDPQTVLDDFKKTGAVSADAMALVRAKHEELARTANQAFDQGGLDSPEFKATEKARQDFWETSVRPMQTAWSNTGRAQQGETAIDTGTFYGLYRAFKQETGREMTPREQSVAKQRADRVAASDQGLGDAERRLIAQLNQATGIGDLAPDVQKALGRFVEESRREARTQGRRTAKKTLDEEAVVIKSNLAAAFKKVTQGSGTHPAGLAGLDPEGEITKYVIQYAKNRVKAGIVDSAQLIDDVHAAIKDFADVGKREVAEALAGLGGGAERARREPTNWTKAKSEIRSGLREDAKSSAEIERIKTRAEREQERQDRARQEKSAQTSAATMKEMQIADAKAVTAEAQQAEADERAAKRDTERVRHGEITQAAKDQRDEARQKAKEFRVRQAQERRAVADAARKKAADTKAVESIQAGLEREGQRETAAEERAKAKTEATKRNVNDLSDIGTRLASGQRLASVDIKTIWQHANDAYVDKGVEFGEAVQRLAADLGATPEQVRRVLATQPGVKPLVDMAYRRMSARRQARSAAEQWVKNADRSPALKAVQGTADAFFNAKTFGHGTVAPLTHVGASMYHPTRWINYFKNMGRTYRAAYSSAAHERYMQDLVNRPNYLIARRGGLKNEPGKFYDEYQNNLAQKMFGAIGKIGNRGFDILKTTRQDFFDAQWNKLDESQKTPEMAKEIATLTNHATGATDRSFSHPLVRTAFFAAPLEVSRWARILGDPVRAVSIFTNVRATNGKPTWVATPAEKYFAKSVVKNHAEFTATYLASLALNQAILTATGSDDKINFTDPSKGDWLRHKIKGRAIESTGGIIATIDFLGKIGQAAFGAQNPREGRGSRMGHAAYQYGRGKLSPFMSTVADFATQADYQERPMPFSSDKEKRGKPRYSWPEYLITQQSPIPIAEAAHDFFDEMHKQGVPLDTTKAIFSAALNHPAAVGKGVGIGITSGGTGVRIGTEYAPHGARKGRHVTAP